ncbi:MAG: sigma-70 family RNA polymerase sigma factor [Planctomycetes bacterium]|nr:sigma-70 family RNA polymerase sigma factor [Planctomycetota bacterium]
MTEALRTDDELMASLGRGDGASLGELVQRYQAPLVGYLTGIVHDADRAKDLAQETFLKIYRHAGVYRTTSRFTTWLFHIARNVARDELRARRRRPQLCSSDEQVIDATAAAQDTQVEALERREVVLRALGQLAARDRVLIVLRDLQGCSYEEIAERTGLALGTVKSGLNRARQRFAERVAELD